MLTPPVACGDSEAHWYAIQTRARHEKKIAVLLQEKSVETYLPLFSHVHLWSDRHQVIRLPLFSCYAFVRLVACPESRHQVLRTPGVLRFVGNQGQGQPIADQQISDIQTLLQTVKHRNNFFD